MENIEHVVALPVNFALRIASDYFNRQIYDVARDILSQALVVVPNNLDAQHLYALCLSALNEKPEALKLLEQVVEQSVGKADDSHRCIYLTNLCSFYERLNRFEEALRAGEEAERLNPKDITLLHNLGVCHYHRRDPARAKAYAERVVALDPQRASSHLLLGESCLALGEFEQGWKEYAWRFNLPGANDPTPKLSLARWSGESIDGRILVKGDQGFGDIFFFWRYVSWLTAFSSLPLAFSVPDDVKALLSLNAPAGSLGFAGESLDRLCAWTTLSDLPGIFGAGIKPDGIPNAPYLVPDPKRVDKWQRWLLDHVPVTNRRVGVCWAGRPEYVNDAKRSLPVGTVAKLIGVPGISMVSLQKGAREDEIPAQDGLPPAGPLFEDWLDTQACIYCLDLVITVDTGIAHLSAAMGKPTYILLPYASEWRWGTDSNWTPWYPSAVLCRQHRPGDWTGVLENVVRFLRETVSPLAGTV